MFGFNPLASAPFSSPTLIILANAYVNNVPGISGSLGTLSFIGEANPVLPAATATMTADDSTAPQSNANITLSAATGTLAANSTDMGSGGGTGTLSTPAIITNSVNLPSSGITGKAGPTLPAATSTFSLALGQSEAKAVTDALTGVALNILAQEFADEDAQGRKTLTGVSATGTANWDTVNGVYAVSVVFAATDFDRERCINIVPYESYTVYIR